MLFSGIITVYVGFACYLRHTGFLFGLLFDPEVGGDMFV
jgi:hypothetical protein